MPINMTMQKPRPRIIRHKPKSYIVPRISNAHNITFDRVDVVGDIAACAADDGECMLEGGGECGWGKEREDLRRVNGMDATKRQNKQ